MPLVLLDLPPELLIQILTALPTKPLLKFAQTSQYARSLAYSNLHTLSLAILPSHRSSWYNKLFSTQHEQKPPSHPDYDPHKVLIRIPQAWNFDYPTLTKFNNKIIASILYRHGCTLQSLDLTLWTLSVPIAQALAALPALRSLSVRIENVQPTPRTHLSSQRKEEQKAWAALASAPGFTWQLRALRIENAELGAAQLGSILNGPRFLSELVLSRCDMLTSSLWDTARLEGLLHLRVADCVNVHVNQTALGTISKMHRLQVCHRRLFLSQLADLARPSFNTSVALHNDSRIRANLDLCYVGS